MSLRDRPTVRRALSFAAAALAALRLAAPTAAAPPEEIRAVRAAAGPGVVVEDFASGLPTELLALDEDLPLALLAAGNDETVRIEDWPVAPDRRETVALTRRDVYAPDARIYRVDRSGPVEVPRSRLVFLWGASEDDEETRVLAWIDPVTGALEGFVDGRGERHELRRAPGLATGGGRAIYRLAPSEVFLPAGAEARERSFRCGAAEAPQAMPLVLSSTGPSPGVWEEAISSLHTATLAVDTDNEFMLNNPATSRPPSPTPSSTPRPPPPPPSTP